MKSTERKTFDIIYTSFKTHLIELIQTYALKIISSDHNLYIFSLKYINNLWLYFILFSCNSIPLLQCHYNNFMGTSHWPLGIVGYIMPGLDSLHEIIFLTKHIDNYANTMT